MGFKAINDRHSHPVGDAALVHGMPPRCAGIFASRRHHRAAAATRFALILMNCSGDDACLLLERLRQAPAGSPCRCRWRRAAAVLCRAAELHAAGIAGAGVERADAALLDAKQLGKDGP